MVGVISSELINQTKNGMYGISAVMINADRERSAPLMIVKNRCYQLIWPFPKMTANSLKINL
jgi:hypothetical protein